MSVNGKTEELTPRQIEFLSNYNDPKSDTFSNAKQSAIKAGYSKEYANVLIARMPDWASENVSRRKRLLEKAEKNLEELLDSIDERVKGDMTKFVAKTLGKDEGYSERTELTGIGGKDLIPDEESRKKSDEAIKSYLNDNTGNTTNRNIETEESIIPVQQ